MRPVRTSENERLIKEDELSRVAAVRIDGCARVRKTYRVPGHLLWRTWLRRPRAQREFQNLGLLKQRGVAVVRPIEWRASGRLGLVRESELVTECLEGAWNMRDWIADRRGEPAVGVLAAAFGRLLADLHAKGLVSLTAYPRNVLITMSDPSAPTLRLCDQPHLVDLGRDLRGSFLASVDLFDAAFSASRRRELSDADREAFLRAYCSRDADRLRCMLERRSRTVNRLTKKLLAVAGRLRSRRRTASS